MYNLYERKVFLPLPHPLFIILIEPSSLDTLNYNHGNEIPHTPHYIQILFFILQPYIPFQPQTLLLTYVQVRKPLLQKILYTT